MSLEGPVTAVTLVSGWIRARSALPLAVPPAEGAEARMIQALADGADALTCGGCGAAFAVANGVPRMLDDRLPGIDQHVDRSRRTRRAAGQAQPDGLALRHQDRPARIRRRHPR